MPSKCMLVSLLSGNDSSDTHYLTSCGPAVQECMTQGLCQAPRSSGFQAGTATALSPPTTAQQEVEPGALGLLGVHTRLLSRRPGAEGRVTVSHAQEEILRAGSRLLETNTATSERLGASACKEVSTGVPRCGLAQGPTPGVTDGDGWCQK